MALTAKSLFCYGLQVTTLNYKLDFRAVIAGPTLTATLDLGFYSPAGLTETIASAMNVADPANNYVVTIDRTILGGTQNRLTITSQGTHLDLLFASGPNSVIGVASLIGFNVSDYTGSLVYTGSSTLGSALIPEFVGFNYSDPMNQAKLFGAVNVAASGLKESIVFNIQKFVDVDFKYEAKANLGQWVNFWYWAIQQRPFDFTPEITNPNYFFQVTLEKTSSEGKGLGFKMAEMLPTLPNHYQTGPMNMRVIDATTSFVAGG